MKNAKRLIAIILSLAMVFSLAGTVAYAESTKEKSNISFAVLSDPHFYPDSLTGDNCEAFRNFCSYNLKLYAQSGDMVRTAIESMLVRNPDLKYILVPGDLTKDGELEGHRELAEIFREYEEKYGVEFLVTTGNHDINQKLSSSFESGKEETAPTATAEDFREIYADFGYDLAFSEYAEKGDNIRGQLSYAADLQDSEGNYTYRLISVDSCI